MSVQKGAILGSRCWGGIVLPDFAIEKDLRFPDMKMCLIFFTAWILFSFELITDHMTYL